MIFRGCCYFMFISASLCRFKETDKQTARTLKLIQYTTSICQKSRGNMKVLLKINLTTVCTDTRLQKSKHLRKRFQDFRQS